MKIVLAPDKYKGALKSIQVANAMEKGIRKVLPDAKIVKLTVSDGGEGLADAILACRKGWKIVLRTTGPENKEVTSSYAFLEDMTAVIELAESAGLVLAKNPNPAKTTTYGTGEMILDALDRNAKEIWLGLGGSATNDAGCGIASCLGVKYFDKFGRRFVPTGDTLVKIAAIDTSEIDERIRNIKIICLTDVDNPLYGPNGAARIYARQKGADDAMIDLLDENLEHYAKILQDSFGFDANFAKAGAAGGTPVSMKAFFHASVRNGVLFLLEECGFGQVIKDADLILTGEGRFDHQSLQGKAVSGIMRKAFEAGVSVYVLAGSVEKNLLLYKPKEIAGLIQVTPDDMNIGEAIKNSETLIEASAENLMIKLIKK